MTHRILIAPGPYKECLTADEVALAMRLGVEDVAPFVETLVRPLSDGGSGIAKLLVDATGGEMVTVEVTGPLGRPVKAAYGVLADGKTAIVESAAACGLALVERGFRNPLLTTTQGVGELILHAAQRPGTETILVGCGDSSTNDCGIGMAAVLGVIFEGLPEHCRPFSGRHLSQITGIDRGAVHPAIKNKKVVVACNLTSILTGPEGTSLVYGPQKGATPEDTQLLAKGVDNFVEVAHRCLGVDLGYLPGAGGAGGLAASLYLALDAHLTYSFDVVGRYIDLDSLLSRASIVFTGEGTIDDRTATGKVACAIGLRAKKHDLPVIAIVGGIGREHEDVYFNGIDAVYSIQDGPMSLEDSIKNAADLVRRATARVTRHILADGRE